MPRHLAALAAACLLAPAAATNEAGTKFLAEKAKEPGVVSLPSGLMYKVLREGEAKKKAVDRLSVLIRKFGLFVKNIFRSSVLFEKAVQKGIEEELVSFNAQVGEKSSSTGRARARASRSWRFCAIFLRVSRCSGSSAP